MSKSVPPRPRKVGRKQRFAIVASQFNAEFVHGLLAHASDELRALATAATITLHEVPGAFEIPVVVRELAVRRKPDAILALGVIIRGETTHADHLARSVTDALQRIAIKHRVPVINAVLSLEDEKQARERCLGERMNRGTEAARAAIGIAAAMAAVRAG